MFCFYVETAILLNSTAAIIEVWNCEKVRKQTTFCNSNAPFSCELIACFIRSIVTTFKFCFNKLPNESTPHSACCLLVAGGGVDVGCKIT